MTEKKEPQKRNTKQRQLVYDAVMGRCDHPSADDIYQAVHEKDDRISKGTVYRNLNVLSEKGEIAHVKVPSADRYDSRLDPHYHLRCRVCGRVFDAPMKYIDEYDADMAAETGFIIESHQLLFEGVCRDCQKAEAAGQST